MAVIVAGKLLVKPGSRDEFLNSSGPAILAARNHPECRDFAVSPDPIDEDRVNIFEFWQSRSALDSFRNSGPDNTAFSLVETFDVEEYEIG